MCGIIGVIGPPDTRIDPAQLASCTGLLRHRGPDDEGYLLGNTVGGRYEFYGGDDTDPRLSLPPVRGATDTFNVGFGHRRLSILDLSVGGHQPMADEAGTTVLVFNGEIYNYRELREELLRLGHRFTSESDTAVLLAAYREWGLGAFDRAIGMWAGAILDTKRRELVCSRDPFGIKPFYYTLSDGRFVFASESKAVLELSGVSRSLNAERTFLFLRWGETDFGSETMFREVRQLPGGCHLVVSIDQPLRLREVPYWRPRQAGHDRIDYAEAVAHTRKLFLKNVSLHMRSDVAIGSALSGGIDSSSIVSSMRTIGGLELGLHTFSYRADDPRISEQRWIDEVNRHTSALPHPVCIDPEEMWADLDRMIYMQDEPFGSTRIYAQYRVYRSARDAGVTVLLNGQGADEVLAGYHYLLGARWAGLVRRGAFRRAARFALATGRLGGWAARQTVAFGARSLVPSWLDRPLRASIRREVAPAWLNRAWFTQRDVTLAYPAAEGPADGLKAELHRALVSASLPHLLRYEDRNSMAWSIESRVPFLTAEFADWLFGLPDDYLISETGRTKHVFRDAMQGIVPDPILDRTDKIGFETPEGDWLRSLRTWATDVLTPEYVRDVPVFDMPRLLGALGGSLRGHAEWRCICFLKWCRRFSISW